MREQASNLLKKLVRHRGDSLPDLAAKALHLTRDSARAALTLRACDEVGAGARCVGGPVVVRNQGRIAVGRDVRFNSRWNPIELFTGPGAELTIGDDVDINYGAMLSARKSVTIGSRVMIGNHSIVADTEQPGTVAPGDDPRPIVIEDDAWLAVRVTVLPGARIGAGAVITAGSVVSGEIPRGVVAGGIPARVLRSAATAADKAGKATPNGHAASGVPAPNGHAASGVPAPNGQGTNGVTTPNGQGTNGVTRKNAALAPEAPPPLVTHRGALIADFTIDELALHLRQPAGVMALEGEAAPFGQVVQTLLQEPAPGAADFAVVWTRPTSAIPSFARVAAFEPVPLENLLAEVDQFCELVVRGAARYRFAFVPTWTAAPYERGLGLVDGRAAGMAHALAAMNLRLMNNLARSNAYVLDAQRWLARVGKNACSPKLWYLGKVPFHSEVFAEAAREIRAAIVALTGGARKLLVLDLDDTLWGGIVGDVGWENLRLGGHDGLGEAFVDFQRGVKNLTRRGIVLAVVSKNEEATALDAIRRHPEMVLREEDFVAHRINWNDKAQNILELARELNLGLQSVVFIDDNPVERARVREALPEVLVPDWPEDKHLYRSALASLPCFDVPAVSKEDAERTALYAAERERERLQANVSSMAEWLKSLGIVVRAEPLGPGNLPRTTQLLNKTNQLNLSTRRLTESELLEWSAGPGRQVWAIHVRDRFGDAGLTGIVSLETSGADSKIVDFVLSCRVMGREVEGAMVHLAVEHARARGAERVEALFMPTSKNKPCLSFWQRSGFASDDGARFVWEGGAYALPPAVQLEMEP